jgi:catechol 2,3-dioxygenase-like lactoylglutathione lyase family enzyme
MVAMLDLFKKPVLTYPVNPRFRAYGKARIDIAQRATNREDWDRLWKRSTHAFPFSWGKSWKHCVEYKVADYPAEVGFFIDILGFPVNAFDPDYAMFTSPNGEFFFSVVPAHEGEESTPPEAIRLQFMIENIEQTAAELERRGIVFEQWPAPSSMGSPLLIGSFRTPNGIGIDLWGFEKDETDQRVEHDRDETIQTKQISDSFFQTEEEGEEEDIDLIVEVEDPDGDVPGLFPGTHSEAEDITEEDDSPVIDLIKKHDNSDQIEPELYPGTQSEAEDVFDEDDSPVIDLTNEHDESHELEPKLFPGSQGEAGDVIGEDESPEIEYFHDDDL